MRPSCRWHGKCQSLRDTADQGTIASDRHADHSHHTEPVRAEDPRTFEPALQRLLPPLAHVSAADSATCLGDCWSASTHVLARITTFNAVVTRTWRLGPFSFRLLELSPVF